MAFNPNAWNGGLRNQYLDVGSGVTMQGFIVDSNGVFWGVVVDQSFGSGGYQWWTSADGTNWTNTGLLVGNSQYFDEPTEGILAQPGGYKVFFEGTTVHFYLCSNVTSGGHTKVWHSQWDWTSPSSPWIAWDNSIDQTGTSDIVGPIAVHARPDGSHIVCINAVSGLAVPNIKVYKKPLAGSFSLLGSVPSTVSFAYIASSVMTTGGDIIVFVGSGPAPIDHFDFTCFTISAAADVISALQMIEQFAGSSNGSGFGVCINSSPGVISGTTAIVGYGFQVFEKNNAAQFAPLRVAFGDLTNPLAPVWTLTTITDGANNVASTSWNFQFMMCQILVNAAGLAIDFGEFHANFDPQALATGTTTALFISQYPTAPSLGPLNGHYRIYLSTFSSGTWSAPALWYDVALDPTSPNFGLVSAGRLAHMFAVASASGAAIGNVYYANTGTGPFCPVS